MSYLLFNFYFIFLKHKICIEFASLEQLTDTFHLDLPIVNSFYHIGFISSSLPLYICTHTYTHLLMCWLFLILSHLDKGSHIITFYCKYSDVYIAQEQRKSHSLADYCMVIKIKKLMRICNH